MLTTERLTYGRHIAGTATCSSGGAKQNPSIKVNILVPCNLAVHTYHTSLLFIATFSLCIFQGLAVWPRRVVPDYPDSYAGWNWVRFVWFFFYLIFRRVCVLFLLLRYAEVHELGICERFSYNETCPRFLSHALLQSYIRMAFFAQGEYGR